jgi:membrane associated rhomboid family serine protease
VVTYTVIAVCIVVYIAPLMFKGFEQRFVFYAPALPQEPWRLITSGFLHDSTGILSVHLVMNMVSIWFIGRVLEPALGRWRYAAVLLIGIVGGNAAMGLIDWTTPALGASGGIFALGGALLVGLRHDRSSLISMAVILGINFVYGFLRAGIAWEAHLGGLVTGVLLGLVYEMGHRKALISAEKARSVATLHVFLTVVLLVIVVALGIYAGNRAWDLYLHSYYSVE